MTRRAAERGAAHPHPGAGWGRRGGGPAGGGRAQRGGGAGGGRAGASPTRTGHPRRSRARRGPRPPSRARWGPRGGKFIRLRPPPAPRPAAPGRSSSGARSALSPAAGGSRVAGPGGLRPASPWSPVGASQNGRGPRASPRQGDPLLSVPGQKGLV